jgi:hypothetical protein
MTPLASCVLATLETASRPINRRELADLCGPHGCKISTAERQIRAAVDELVMAGHPIYSDGKGFRIASSAAEMQGWIAAREKACASERLKLRRLRQLLPTMQFRTSQQNLFEVAP